MYQDCIERMRSDPYALFELQHLSTPDNHAAVEVIPGLYLGTSEWYQALLPDVVINVAAELDDSTEEIETHLGRPVPYLLYHKYHLFDVPTDDLEFIVREVCPIVHRYLTEKKTVVIHCHLGKSRSFSVLAAYLMVRYGLSVVDIIHRLFSKGWYVTPNEGYCRYLLTI